MQGDDARDVVPLLLCGHRRRGGEHVQLAAEPLEFVVLDASCHLEDGELRAVICEDRPSTYDRS
ncbi:hypothetical protein ACTWQF_24735 [Streptomyces sp. 8N114]